MLLLSPVPEEEAKRRIPAVSSVGVPRAKVPRILKNKIPPAKDGKKDGDWKDASGRADDNDNDDNKEKLRQQ